ncbi:hypothetical protein [Haloarchaeobius sp. HME9146]|uniref:hypothetical protein n=1 Tax=Haloarchaeobius sp. HME9146 TaxID=2978732 RepID=UPI0021C11664|nr:hypothetical protein [Haloarchaeobius sp. HME9146]MCT9098222.1 hypothetical protein [Haloarchaeobius sp. HME9146]
MSLASSRRRFLQTVGSALVIGTAGCLSDRSPGTDTEPQTSSEPVAETTSGTTTTQPEAVTLAAGEPYDSQAGWSVVVDHVSVQRCYVEFGTTHTDPRCGETTQFVVATVRVSGADAPDPATLDIGVESSLQDDETYRRRNYAVGENDEDEVAQTYAFPVPFDPAPTAASIVWRAEDGQQPTVRWELSEPHLQRLANPPQFEVRAFDMPAHTSEGEQLSVSVTVANVGARDGTFIAELGDAAMSDQPEIAIEVPEDESVTETFAVDARFSQRDEMTVVLRWGDDTLTRTVTRGTTTTE